MGRNALHRAFRTGLTVSLIACSSSPVAPDPSGLKMSVLYSNKSSNVCGYASPDTNCTPEPGTAVITWLSPGTVSQVNPGNTRDGVLNLYGPGFRTDKVLPGESTCAHFTAPSDSVVEEMTETFIGATGVQGPGTPITWHSDSTWVFNGETLAPVGVIAGC
jgi:hypothetical protein